MHITNQGNVYIGVSPADFGGSYSNITTPHRVAVNGNILATGFHARIYSNWPDYVFSEGYELESLDSLASFIRANHHLPGMPSASEVESNGVELAEMNRLLLEHIERLYLHIMELNRKLEQR
jgi:hypothetical protein